MPIQGDYSYAILDGDSAVPTLINKPRKVYPVSFDKSIYLTEEDYQILTEYYEPANPGQAHDIESNLFFLKDTPLRPAGNGTSIYTRAWANLPGYDGSGNKSSYVSQDWESYVWTVPGIETANQTTLAWAITAMTISGNNHIITTSAPHDIVEDHGVVISYAVNDPLNKFTYYRIAHRVALAGTGGSSVVVRQIKDINTVTGLQLARAVSKQDPFQKTISSRVDVDFWLPGITPGINSGEDIPVIEQFFIIDGATGNRTEYLSENSTPTIAEYRQWVEDEQWIPIESSIVRRYEGGSVMTRTTRYGRAQF